MHFRHFIISGLLVGAALCLPNNVFAEKNELNGQQHTDKVSVQVTTVESIKAAVQPNVQEKAKKAKSLERMVEVPEPASKSQSGGNQKPAKTILQHERKPVATLKNLPEQAQGKAQAVINKAKKIVESPGHAKVTAEQQTAKGLVKKKQTSKQEVGKVTFPLTKTKVKNIAFVSKVEPQRERSHFTKPNKQINSKSQPKKKAPFEKKEELPMVGQLSSPTQQTNSSGGPSHDRVSHGLSSTSLMDKWFEWHKYYEIKLVQPYLSRNATMSNQWMNAPPSPPPQTAPFLKSVSRN